jgi:hypothetical protein
VRDQTGTARDQAGAVIGAIGLATAATSSADELKRLIRLARRGALQISGALRREGHTRGFQNISH